MNEAKRVPAAKPGAGLDSNLDLSRIKTVEGIDVRGKRVLVRVDFNVPIENGVVADATRLERVLPTIARLAAAGAKVIVLSHLGRPKEGPSSDTSLRPVAMKMRELMPGRKVHFIGDCVGEEPRRNLATLKPGEIAVLENLRFYPGEEKNDKLFAKRLAEHGDIYVNDAFSTAHRAHASVDAIADLLPSHAGLLMMAEIAALGRALENPERPVMGIVGGAKVSTKIEVLTHLVSRMDVLVVGGGMANTFLLAQGIKIGSSLSEPDFLGTAKEIMARAAQSGCEIVLPKDVVIADALKEGVEWRVCPVTEVPDGALILDFGPESIAALKERLKDRPHRAVERTSRRLRDAAFRRGDVRARPRGGEPHQGRQARERGGRRRYGAGAERGGRGFRLHLYLDRRRRFSRMARRPRSARGRGAGKERRPPLTGAATSKIPVDSLQRSFPPMREFSNHRSSDRGAPVLLHCPGAPGNDIRKGQRP